MFHQVADLFHDLDNGMLPISVLLPYLPIPAHWRRDRRTTAPAGIRGGLAQRRVPAELHFGTCSAPRRRQTGCCSLQGQAGVVPHFQPHHPEAARQWQP